MHSFFKSKMMRIGSHFVERTVCATIHYSKLSGLRVKLLDEPCACCIEGNACPWVSAAFSRIDNDEGIGRVNNAVLQF